MESLDQRMRDRAQQARGPQNQQGKGQEGKGQNSQQSQSGQQGQNGQSSSQSQGGQQGGQQGGSPNGGDRNGSPQNGGAYGGDARNWGGYGGGWYGYRWNPDDIRQFRNQWREWANDAEALRRQLQQAGMNPRDLDDVLRDLRQFENDRLYADPQGLENLQQAIVEEQHRAECSEGRTDEHDGERARGRRRPGMNLRGQSDVGWRLQEPAIHVARNDRPARGLWLWLRMRLRRGHAID